LKNMLSASSNITYVKRRGVEFVQFPIFKKFEDVLVHCFTTRRGGVSVGECESLNLSFNRNDSRENVMENFKRIASALDIDYRNMVLSSQVHGCRVLAVTKDDRGKGLVRSSDIFGYDGLVTDQSEVALVTFYADCVPLFFFDSKRKAIGLSHSGWRGTVKNIAAETIRVMKEAYGTDPQDIYAAIGPSIGCCCFEVGQEVHDEFINAFSWSRDYCKKDVKGKYFIDLQGIIKKSMIDEGIPEDRICISGVCTKCNNHIFFSHRGDKGRTGSLAAIMQIR